MDVPLPTQVFHREPALRALYNRPGTVEQSGLQSTRSGMLTPGNARPKPKAHFPAPEKKAEQQKKAQQKKEHQHLMIGTPVEVTLEGATCDKGFDFKLIAFAGVANEVTVYHYDVPYEGALQVRRASPPVRRPFPRAS